MNAALLMVEGIRLTVILGDMTIVCGIKKSLVSSTSLIRMFIGTDVSSTRAKLTRILDEILEYKQAKATVKSGLGHGNSALTVNYYNPLWDKLLELNAY